MILFCLINIYLTPSQLSSGSSSRVLQNGDDNRCITRYIAPGCARTHVEDIPGSQKDIPQVQCICIFPEQFFPSTNPCVYMWYQQRSMSPSSLFFGLRHLEAEWEAECRKPRSKLEGWFEACCYHIFVSRQSTWVIACRGSGLWQVEGWWGLLGGLEQAKSITFNMHVVWRVSPYHLCSYFPV